MVDADIAKGIAELRSATDASAAISVFLCTIFSGCTSRVTYKAKFFNICFEWMQTLH